MIRHYVTAWALVLASATTVSAQTRATTGDLRITVRDETGSVLQGALVVVTRADTGLTRTLTTGDDGQIEASALPIGRYTVHAERAGFTPATLDPIDIDLGTATELNLTLRLASFESVINVVVASPLVDIQKTVVATLVGGLQIADLPIDRRNYISFAVIAPGVSSDRTPNQGPAESSGLTIAGQSARANNITVDGLDNNDDVVGGVRALFSQDAVHEFQVIVNSYSAEFGKASGGVVNIVTESGTNNVASDIFEFYRDRALNSRGYFDDFDASGQRVDRPKAPFRQQQFGGALGGPLVKNRTFGFASFERLILGSSNAVSIDDRTEVLHPFAPLVLGTPVDILRQAGFPVEVGNVPFSTRSTTALFKIDHALSATHTLGVRFNLANGVNGNSQPFGGIVARSRGGLLDNRDYVFAGSISSSGGGGVLNELRAQVARRNQVVQSLDPRCGGPCIGNGQGGPAVEITGVARVGRQNFTPQPRVSVRYEVLDTLSLETGPHHLKTGLDFDLMDTRHAALPLNFGGQFVFVDIPAQLATAFGLPGPLSAVQAFALRLPVAYIQGSGEPSTTDLFQDISGFVQDEWRGNPRLSLRLGARYQKQFWPNGSYTAVGYPGSYAPHSGNHDIAPRIGVAWDPRGDGRAGLTAAYGLFFGNQFNAPFTASQIVDGHHVRVAVVQGAQAVAAWPSPDHRLPMATLSSLPSVTLSVAPSFPAPYTHHSTVSFNRQLGREVVLTVSGVVVKGNHYVSAIDYNPTLPDLGPGRRPGDIGGIAGTSASGLQYTPWGESWYRGVLLSLTKRLSRGSQALVSYTWSKAEDSISDFISNPPQDQGRGRNRADPGGLPVGFDPAAERGPSLQDQRHRLVVSGIQELPRAFQVAGILTIGSGRPFNIIAGADLNRDGDATVSPGPDRARVVLSDPSTSLPRNTGLLPGETRFDLRATKRFKIGPRSMLTATVDVLNVFNATNFTDINRVFGVGAYPTHPLPSYGQFTQDAPPRQVQVGARMTF